MKMNCIEDVDYPLALSRPWRKEVQCDHKTYRQVLLMCGGWVDEMSVMRDDCLRKEEIEMENGILDS